jgi:hypothetical protein
MTPLQSTNLDILNQLKELLEAVSDKSYATPLALLHGSSVGQHVRHTLEFYQCLLHQSPSGQIDYDARLRNLQLETDPAVALLAVEVLTEKILLLNPDTVLQLHSTFQEHTIKTKSTLARELIYLIEHTIHHFAIIKIALHEQYPDVKLPANFGVAYSTIKYHLQQ